eukprot:9146695-Lingulodinium_polyedra.AAC.1
MQRLVKRRDCVAREAEHGGPTVHARWRGDFPFPNRHTHVVFARARGLQEHMHARAPSSLSLIGSMLLRRALFCKIQPQEIMSQRRALFCNGLEDNRYVST